MSNGSGKYDPAIFAISTPKRRIVEVIEDARNFIRVGDDLGKPQHIGTETLKIANKRSVSTNRTINNSSKTRADQLLNRLDYQKMEPFLKDFLKDKHNSSKLGQTG